MADIMKDGGGVHTLEENSEMFTLNVMLTLLNGRKQKSG